MKDFRDRRFCKWRSAVFKEVDPGCALRGASRRLLFQVDGAGARGSKGQAAKLPGCVGDREEPDGQKGSAERRFDGAFAGQGLGDIPNDGSSEPKTAAKPFAPVLR